jgi:hypothetical protein
LHIFMYTKLNLMNYTKMTNLKLSGTCLCLMILIPILLSSCLNDSETISPENVSKVNPDTSNIAQLTNIANSLSNLKHNKVGLEKMKSILKSKDKAVEIVSFIPNTILVSVKDSVAKLFDPDLQPCIIPEKVLNKLKKYKKDKESWVPKELAKLIGGMPDKALYMKGTGLTVVLHTVNVKHVNNTMETIIIIGAPTFSAITLGDWVSKASDNNFGYTLDCSGMLSAAIAGTATVPGADIKTAAASSMDKKSSLFVGAGVVISPLYTAYYGDASSVKMSSVDRIAILTALINTPGINDTDDIELVMSYEVIWSSSKGEQGFNGSASFYGKGGLGVGIAQVSGSSDISGTVSRSSTYGSFDTYLTGRQRLNSPGHVTLNNIRSLIQQLRPI